MSKFQRAFLVVEGEEDSYPNHETARVYITADDPSELTLKSPSVCSPIFPFHEDGIDQLPSVNGYIKISFLIVPNTFPTFNYIKENFGTGTELWFSLGLANLIVIEGAESSIATEIIEYLEREKNLTAFETWRLKEGMVVKEDTRRFKFFKGDDVLASVDIKLSSSLPGYLSFAVSEYKISVNKFLTASKKFTPHYYARHLATINASKLFVDDLTFLCGDYTVEPSFSLMGTLGVTNSEEAAIAIADPANSKLCEELINVKHSMIVQFNSSMSYIYTQAYSGTFPLFDHHGIVRRYSLLGIGSGVSALFELIIQIEQAMYSVPFESLEETTYNTQYIAGDDYFKHFIQPAPFEVSIWSDDDTRKGEVEQSLNTKSTSPEDGFFHRLAFFSGRLGFREHEFCATSAIQVLVDGHSLRWNIINYTHEIIHNHVRILLNNLLVPQSAINDQSYTLWVDSFRGLLKAVILGYPNKAFPKISYKTYFTLTLFNFAAFSNFYGSLNRPSNYGTIQAIRAAGSNKKTELQLVTCDELKELLQNVHKDITEIFVHIIDYCYIYNKKLESYLASIWLSWSTMPAVAVNIKQYILRSLIIVSLDLQGNSNKRFESSLLSFRKILSGLAAKGIESTIIATILSIINNETEKRDLKFRFYNCIIVGDLAYNFLVAKMEKILNNADPNLAFEDDKDEFGNPISYSIKTNSFEGKNITSKVRFLIDQLEREIARGRLAITNQVNERTSAWLLLSLASHNN